MKIDEFHPDIRNKVRIGNFLKHLFSGEWRMRKLAYPLLRLSVGQNVKGLHNEERLIDSLSGGPQIRIKIYKPLNNQEKLPVMLYIHGGGKAVGCPEMSGSVIKDFIDKRPCIVVAPDYRKSVQSPFPSGFNDCYDTLKWINNNSELLGAETGKIIVAGHSGGGGLTAAVTLKSRDTKEINIAFQMPIYPMLDDRHETASSQLDAPCWNNKANVVAWDIYLQDLKRNNLPIPPYAAPARNNDYSDFPPTISFVGGAEVFKEETITYFEQLNKYQIPNEFKLFDGCFHGFELFAPNSMISKTANTFLLDSYAKYYDTYL